MKSGFVSKVLLFVSATFTATAGAATAKDSGRCLNGVRSGVNPDLVNQVAQQFKSVYGVNLDWRQTVEVSDDAEGSNCIFSIDNDRTVTLPIELAAETAPNKYGGN